MGVYIYTIKDRWSDEVLFIGRITQCAGFLECSERKVHVLACRTKMPSKNSRWSGIVIERQWNDAIFKCVDCGAELPNSGPMRRRCPECKEKRQQVLRQRHRDKQKQFPDVEASQEELQRFCHGCYYFGGENYINSTCNYIFMEGHSRGCPGGDGCTKRKERKK